MKSKTIKKNIKITKNTEIIYPLSDDAVTCVKLMRKQIPILIRLIDEKSAELRAKISDYMVETLLDDSQTNIITDALCDINKIVQKAHNTFNEYKHEINGCKAFWSISYPSTKAFHELLEAYGYIDAIENDQLNKLPDYIYDNSINHYPTIDFNIPNAND